MYVADMLSVPSSTRDIMSNNGNVSLQLYNLILFDNKSE